MTIKTKLELIVSKLDKMIHDGEFKDHDKQEALQAANLCNGLLKKREAEEA